MLAIMIVMRIWCLGRGWWANGRVKTKESGERAMGLESSKKLGMGRSYRKGMAGKME